MIEHEILERTESGSRKSADGARRRLIYKVVGEIEIGYFYDAHMTYFVALWW